MKYVSQKQQIHENEIVLTSGLGGNLPKGLVIGQITRVEQRDSDMFQQATVRPTVDFERLEMVLIIVSFEPVDVTEEGPDATEEAEGP
jgi:rod shape-determining protein MreC